VNTNPQWDVTPREKKYIIHCLILGLSDHDAQLIMLNNVIIPYQASEANLITK
jgi:hypothetical protein